MSRDATAGLLRIELLEGKSLTQTGKVEKSPRFQGMARAFSNQA
jgi:hypothetical protein